MPDAPKQKPKRLSLRTGERIRIGGVLVTVVKGGIEFQHGADVERVKADCQERSATA